ncbi:hypothetical protein [Parasphingorhabdus sp.]|uniref:hypothetical protein n=1 Tax=Parasphingorhabdus sp. TaxID=2709688 RepID=UPI0032EF26F1
MAGLATSFVPILAVMSGQAEQLEAQRASVEDMEVSLTALLAGQRFDRKMSKSADFDRETGMGGPDPDEEEAEKDDKTTADPSNPKDASNSSIIEPSASPDPLETDVEALNADEALLDGRRRPGVQKQLPDPVTQFNPGAVNAPPPEAFPTDEFPVPDRWRIMQSLCPAKGGDESIYTLFGALRNNCQSTLNPYAQNVLKGDKPIPADKKPGFLKGDDWFFVANVISDTVIEPRSFPIPVGVQTTERPNSLDVFGRSGSEVYAQTFITGFALIKGSTAYKPPDVEYRLTLATQVNHVNVPERRVLFVEPSKPSHRTDWFVGVQEAFFDYHIRNTSARYDFDSFRIGIQPMQADFRGFLFQDNQLGFRLFGTRDNNRIQYNLGAFVQLEKDTNSGLNDITQTPRESYIFFANLYRQDLPFVGLTSQFSLTYNMNREKSDVEIDDNGFPVRPALLGDLRGRAYDVVYPGYAFDGRIGRINLTGQVYGAFGEDRNSFFTSEPAKIEAYFGALEASYDVDFLRFRASGLFASGDGNPYNNTEAGFDAIFENPIFAGADTSYWIRQTIPFAGGGRVISINGRNGILNSLRSSKEQGQSNFNNPGTILAGVGVDADLTPDFRLSGNANHLWFHKTESLEALRVEGSIPRDIGWDLSLAAIYRPKATQNMVFRLSGAALIPGKGFKDLFDQTDTRDFHYSILLNAILAF